MLFFFVCIVLLIQGEINAQSRQNNAESYYQNGKTHFDNNRFLEAITAYSQAIRIDSDFAEAYLYRGQAYLVTNDFNSAMSDLNRAIEIFLNTIGRYDVIMPGLSDETNRLLNLVAEPRLYDYANAYFIRATCWSRLNNHDRAIEDGNMAIRINPRHETAYFDLGQYYGYKEMYDQAIAAFEKTVEIDPKNADYWIWLGNSYLKRNLSRDYPKMKMCFEEYLKLTPNGEHAQFARGVLNELRRLGF